MTEGIKGQAPVLTVSQLTNAIKLCLEGAFPLVWVKGEVSNCKLQSSGHLYFSLKDEETQIAVAMFRGDVQSLSSPVKDGDSVIIRGELNVYGRSGKYQIIAKQIQHVGLGALLLRLEELKKKIHQRGWFKNECKKPLPHLPKKIGIVTSPTGAAIRDVLNVLKRRFSGFHLIINPVRVQGDEAAGEIAEAIRQFNHHKLVDVIIVCRGGGSIEDLWAFNEESVAEAIFYSDIPIICAVGHETDHCIAEYVADLRAPTPSAAAEVVMAEKAGLLDRLSLYKRRITQHIYQHIHFNRQKLSCFQKLPLFSSPYPVIGPWMQKLDDLKEDLETTIYSVLHNKQMELKAKKQEASALNPRVLIRHFQQKFLFSRRSLDTTMQETLRKKKEKLNRCQSMLYAINPKELLKKGYSISINKNSGHVITSIKAVNKGDQIKTLLHDGYIESSTTNTISSK